MKKAFLIGNFNYIYLSKLYGVENDIKEIENILKLKDFEIFKFENLNFESFLKFTQNESLIDENDEIIFYYAGHGLQIFDRFYFVPVDCKVNEIKKIEELEKQAIYLDDVVKMLSKTQNIKIIIIDACRNSIIENEILSNDDFFNKGLFEVEKYNNYIISFSTNSGNISIETKYNGIFTKNLIKYLKKYKLSIYEILQKTRIDVMKDTNCSQIPWEYSSLKKEYFLSNLSLKCINKIPMKYNGIENICSNKKDESLISTQKLIKYINFSKRDYVCIQQFNDSIIKKEEINQPIIRNFSLQINNEYIEKIKYHNYKKQFYITTNIGNLYVINPEEIIKSGNALDSVSTINYFPKQVFSLNNKSLFGLEIKNEEIIISDEDRNIYILQNEQIIEILKCDSDIYDIIYCNDKIFFATYNGFYELKNSNLIHIRKSKNIIIDYVYKVNNKIYFSSPNFIGVYNIQNNEITEILKVKYRVKSFCIYRDRFVIFWDERNVLSMYDFILQEYVDEYENKNINGNIYGIDIIENYVITRCDCNHIGFWQINN